MTLSLATNPLLAFVCALHLLGSSVTVNAWVTRTPSSFSTWLPLIQRSNPSQSRTVLALDSRGDDAPAEEGANLAAELFRLAQKKGIGVDASDLIDEDDEDEDDDDDEDDEETPNFPQGAINAFLGYDTGDVGEKLAGNVSLTNDQLYNEVKERVLDTAGGFVEYVKSAREDDDDDDDDDDLEINKATKAYVPPEIVPNAEFTAGEVVLQVLESLRNNNVPTPNKGVEILFGFSSPNSQVKAEVGLTPTEYADFLKETEYKVMLDPAFNQVSIEKADYSVNGKKAFFTARLMNDGNTVNVNFILSSCDIGAEDQAWLVDSILIRPESMRRRRRR